MTKKNKKKPVTYFYVSNWFIKQICLTLLSSLRFVHIHMRIRIRIHIGIRIRIRCYIRFRIRIWN